MSSGAKQMKMDQQIQAAAAMRVNSLPNLATYLQGDLSQLQIA